MKKYLFVLTILSTTLGHSQEENYTEQFAKIVQVPNSPEAEAFAKYGEVDANLYTGTPNISVPLYTIKGKEMDFPISLTYDASGVKVRQVATNVGLGWNLNVGGRVSRQTKGHPDHGDPEVKTLANTDNRNRVNNYMDITPIGQTSFNATTALGGGSFASSVDNVEEYYLFLSDVQKGKIDVEQDYFSVDGMGLNETLWMDTASYLPVPLNDPNLKVLKPDESPSSDPEYWKIQDSNGIIYVFGQDLDSTTWPYTFGNSNPIEKVRMYCDNDTQSGNPMDFVYNSSWLLSKIISANGKDVYHFEYSNYTTYSNPTKEELVGQSVTHSLKSIGGGNTEYNGAGAYPLNNRITNIKSFYTQQLLKAIYHNGKKVVTFQLGDRTDIESGTGRKVTGLKVYDDASQSGAQPIQEITFEQSYFGDENATEFDKKRLKLDKVFLSDEDPENYYSFIYNSPGEVCSRFDSNAFDTMGYFNGQNCPTPFKEFERLGDIELPGSSRNVSTSASKVGILEKLIYPAGGTTEFLYENHNNGIDNFPGLRIQAIKNYSDNGSLATQRAYEYLDFMENYVPILNKEVLGQSNPCAPSEPSTTLYRYVMPTNMDGGPYISYGKVREHRYDGAQDNGYVEYTFNTGPDSWTTMDSPPFEKNYNSNTLSGKPSGKTIKDKFGTTQLEEINSYNGTSPPQHYNGEAVVLWNNPLKSFSFVKTYIDGNNDLIIFTGSGDGSSSGGGGSCSGVTCNSCNPPISGSVFQIVGNYCDGYYTNEFCFSTNGWAALELKKISIDAFRVNPVSSVTKEYFPNGFVQTASTQEYSQDGLFLKATNTTYADGTTQRVEYTYPLDILSPTNAETQLIQDNKLYTPIVTRTLKVDGGNTNLLSTKRTDYQIFGIGSNTFTLPKKMQFEKGGTGSNLEDRIIFNKYDSSGNPAEVYMEDGEPTCYIWGYDHQYPVAKIENIEYSQVPLISSIEAETNETNLLSLLDQLRNHSNTANSLVTTYTHKPGIGVSTITDPSGNKLRYIYDANNRLKYVLDKDDKVLSENSYHLRSKTAIDDAYINEIGQGVEQGYPYVEFEVITTNVTPSTITNFDYNWTTENGINPINNNGNSTIKIFYNCAELEGDSLQVSCLVSDGDEEYVSEKVSDLIIPDSCIISGNIVVDSYSSDSAGNFVLFKIDNLQGGDGTNVYSWTLESAAINEQSSGGVDFENRFKVYYNCSLMHDFIRVSCYASSNNGAEGTLYGNDSPCVIEASISLETPIDFGNKILFFKANALGGHVDGFTYYWSYNDPNCHINEGAVIDQVTFPFNDEEGNYYLQYDCMDCTGTNNPNDNFGLEVTLVVYHSNGGSFTQTWGDVNTSIEGTCTPY